MQTQVSETEPTSVEVLANDVETTDDIDSFEDAMAAVEGLDGQDIVLGDKAFRAVYRAAHGSETTPDQRVQTGQVLQPIVRSSARNVEQELSITVPVLLPDGETVKTYTALYGSEKPDETIDKMLREYTDGEKFISKLAGISMPLIYHEGEWKLYIISTEGWLGIRAHAWFAENLRALVQSDDIVAFGKTYDTPFEDDPQIIEEGRPADLKAIAAADD